MEFIQIEVTPRERLGSSHSGRLRRDGKVPAVLYGMSKDNLTLAIAEADLERFLRSGSHLVELRLGGKTRPAIIRELQVDPVTDRPLHVDFHRVDADQEVDDHVPVYLKGRPLGEGEGGITATLMETVAVRCRPKFLPKEVVLDISKLALGEGIRVRDLAPLDQVAFTDDPDAVIVQVTTPKRVAAESEEGEEGGEGAATEGGTAAAG